MNLEEKVARALAAAYCLGRNREVNDENLWESWLPEAKRVLEVDLPCKLSDNDWVFDEHKQNGTQIVTPYMVNREPIKLDKNIPQ